MLDKASQLQWIQGFKVGTSLGGRISVFHLLYADDTLIFYEADRSQMLYLNLFFFCLSLPIFEAISGLHISILNNVTYPVNTVPNNSQVSWVVLIYPLLHILEAKFKSADVWNGTIEKPKKEAGSLATAVSFNRDRFALINSVLDNIPTYIMSTFPTPRKVLSQLNKIRDPFCGRVTVKIINST